MPCSHKVDFAYIDSGTGGIPYLLHLEEKTSEATCIYVADTANFPYGEKSHDQIVKAVVNLCGKIIDEYNPAVIVMACNTMSVNALQMVREVYPDTHFVGTVPAIKLAASVSEKKCIGLLATNSTINHPYNQDLKNLFASDCKMALRGDPDLISFIEHESFLASAEEKQAAVKPAVDYFRKEGCDAIILGCTHFLNLKEEFVKEGNPDIKIVDSCDGVTNRALQLWGVAGTPARKGGEQQSVSQGKAFPSNNRAKLFITGFSDKKDEKEYSVICERYNLEFGGVLK